MRHLLLAVAVLLAGCGGDEEEPVRRVAVDEVEELTRDAPTDAGMRPDDRPGNPAVYDRIDALEGCDELEEELETHVNNAELREPGDVVRTVSIAYAQTTLERLLALGCR